MKHVLIIENDRCRREQTADTFRTSSHRIQFAATVSDAVCLVETAVPDAVIVSVPYLDQSGFGTLQRVTRLFPSSRVLAITTAVAVVEYSRDTCVAAYRLTADLSSAVRELLALVEEGFWDGEKDDGEGLCPTRTLAQQSCLPA